MIDKLLQHFIPNLNDHLSDDRLASLFCNELSLIDKLIAKRHLVKCWHCRVRQGDLEGPRADRIIDLYREVLNREDLKMSPEPRAQFAQRLELHIKQLPPRRWRFARLFKISFIHLPPTNLSLAVLSGFAFASTFIFLFLWQQRAPDITANTLLVRAERWDSSNPATVRGVVYQSVRITAPRLTMERSIYRDLEGKRSPKQVKLAVTQQKLKDALERAGINWDEPMSASDYQTWHDHQHVRSDKIARAGKHLLKLTTTLPDNSASPQSITVRDTDFHPVRRTVALRDVGTVEIAELDYKILPWAAVGADVFEPVGMPTTIFGRAANVLPFPRLPQIESSEQLDEAELGARLILNQLHADSGEQIDIRRNSQSVEVEGIVDTDERKRELQAQLRMVPHLTFSVQSVADLKNSPVGAGTTGVQEESMPDQPSPLEISLRAHGRSISEINALAQRFFNVALTISQESKAIVDLQTRFAPDSQRTIVAAATLAELVYSHRERLEAELKSERALLAEARSGTGMSGPSRPGIPSLADAANRNLALLTELTQTNSPATRSAEQILEEMSISVDDLTAASDVMYGKSPSASTLSGKK